MNTNQYTQKTLEALQAAQQLAVEYQHNALEPEHLLHALASQEQGLIPQLLQKLNVDPGSFAAAVAEKLSALPRVSGSGRDPDKVYISQATDKVLSAAAREAKAMKDEYVSVEHVFLGLLDEPTQNTTELFRAFNIKKDAFLQQLTAVRGNQRVTNDNPEDTYNALQKYGQDLVDLARKQKLDPVIGRDQEIRNVIRILSRKTKNNPCLIGEPGVGKTAIAEGIAERIAKGQVPAGLQDKEIFLLDLTSLVAGTQFRGQFEQRVKGLLSEVKAAGNVILFIDEIHRFNKGQQDYLLPYVEDGTIILIGATTENPYFEVNGALISRSVIFELKPIPREAIKELLKKAVYDTDRGMGAYNGTIDEDALDFLADISGGDARHALNAIELGIMTTEPGPDGKIHITLDVAQQCIQKRAARYDKNGDNHYDTISAFIKSMRGSDPDAAVYYLARMLNAGESVTFIARRIMICASEDVGNADPQALVMAVNASLAVERVGMPEAQIILAQAVTYIATAPKSNRSCEAVFQAMQEVQATGDLPIPAHLQDAHYKGAAKLGHGTGYKYAHDYPNDYVEQQYLPYELSGREFYQPSGNGYEVKIREHMARIKKEAAEASSENKES